MKTSIIITTLLLCLATTQAETNNQIQNGQFDDKTQFWKQAYPGGKAEVVTEKQETFLRITTTDPKVNAGLSQQFPLPARARQGVLQARMRGRPDNAKSSGAEASIALRFKDAAGAMLSAEILKSPKSLGWQTEKTKVTVPSGTKQVEIVIRCLGTIGTFDFDDIRLEFE